MLPAIYLIDFENVNTPECLDLPSLSDQDEIHVFYTEHCPKISLDTLNGVRARFYVHKVPSGSQEVDMHISGRLGYFICRYGNTKDYYIISNDKGYTHSAEDWKKEEDVNVCVRPYIGCGPQKKEEPVAAIPQKTQSSVKTELNNRILAEFTPKYSSVTAGRIASMVIRNYGKKNSKQLIYRALLKEMKKETGCMIYNDLKESKLI